jgi:hypothetical protein
VIGTAKKIVSVGVNVVLASEESWGSRVRIRAPQGARDCVDMRLRRGARPAPTGPRRTNRMSSGAFGAHAEVVALGLARTATGGWDLAGEGPELEEITTFDEGPLAADRAEQFEARGIEAVGDVLRDEALAVFRTYRKAVDSADGIVVHNARGGTE